LCSKEELSLEQLQQKGTGRFHLRFLSDVMADDLKALADSGIKVFYRGKTRRSRQYVYKKGFTKDGPVEGMKMDRSVIPKTVLAAALMTVSIGTSMAGDDIQKRIAHARAAAPTAVSADATIVIDGEVVVEGSNGWTCMPDVMPGDNSAVCIDAAWGEMMGAIGAKEPFKATSLGLSYMLLGDPPGGGVSNSTPYADPHKDAKDYVETGPHLMLIAPKEMLAGYTDDPSTGGPYVMWGDTDYAHLMIPVNSQIPIQPNK
jgi:hypothetical protein